LDAKLYLSFNMFADLSWHDMYGNAGCEQLLHVRTKRYRFDRGHKEQRKVGCIPRLIPFLSSSRIPGMDP
jgi:hypothetical protein